MSDLVTAGRLVADHLGGRNTALKFLLCYGSSACVKQAARLEEAAASRAADKAARAQAVEQLRAQLGAETAKTAGDCLALTCRTPGAVNLTLDPNLSLTLDPDRKLQPQNLILPICCLCLPTSMMHHGTEHPPLTSVPGATCCLRKARGAIVIVYPHLA
jgi:hypothetical protein